VKIGHKRKHIIHVKLVTFNHEPNHLYTLIVICLYVKGL